jgi:UDP-N-acetylmuramate--alanine ligase
VSLGVSEGDVLGRTRHIHFVGIGGIGMSGIAELLANLGYTVSGSDAKRSPMTDRLARLGVDVHEGHDAANVGESDVVVVSSAIRPDNPEVVEARRLRVPVIPRAEMLAELMRLRYGIAVAGSHGKTSTTSMIALVLERAGLDPTAVIGGRLSAFGSNARLGRGDYMVAEADESDGSFLRLTPALAVITNVDREHLDHYGDFDHLCQAFVDFADRVPFYGAVIACADDRELRQLIPRFTRRVVTYGIDAAEADLVGEDVRLEAFGARCRVVKHAHDGSREALGEVHLRVPGRHNLLNALATVVVGLELDLAFDRVASALAQFQGAERRFQLLGEVDGTVVVDDYGHHPTEIAAVVAAARADANRRLVIVFQPHRYSRTAQLWQEFAAVLGGADEVVLTDVYAAGEDPLPGVGVELIADAMREGSHVPVHVVVPLDAIAPYVARLARPGDLVITLGAGSIGTVGERILHELDALRGAGARG